MRNLRFHIDSCSFHHEVQQGYSEFMSNYYQVQLTLEQYKIELGRSTYTFFFFYKYTFGPMNPRGRNPQLRIAGVEDLLYALLYAILYRDLSIHGF